MRRVAPFLAILCVLAVLVGARAQTLSIIPFASGGYSGPGDTVSFTAWWGLRAYSAAIAAAGTQKSLDLRRASDNATCSPKIGTSGLIDLTVGTVCNGSTQTVTAWLNNASSCTASIATTTMTVTACSAGNLAVGLPVAGVNVAANTWITALGTGTGGTGTYTVSVSQTAVSATVTAPAWSFVSNAYDQVGGNVCNSLSCDWKQATAANQPRLLLTGCTTLGPCLITAANNSGDAKLQSANNFATAGSGMSLATVAARMWGAGSTTATTAITTSASGGINALMTETGSNTWSANTSGQSLTGSASKLAFHSAVGVIRTTGVTSTLNIDGTETTGTNLNASGTASAPRAIVAIQFSATGIASTEGGFIDNTFLSSMQRTALCHSQANYWGITATC